VESPLHYSDMLDCSQQPI